MSTRITNESQRPERPRLCDFAGRPLSLPNEPTSWEQLGEAGADKLLLLGSGPGVPVALPFVRTAMQEGKQIYCLDAPQDSSSSTTSAKSFPTGWQRLSPAEALAFAPSATVYFYRPAMRLAPEFWGPFLGKLAAKIMAGDGKGHKASEGRTIWLPGNSTQLMHLELYESLAEAGFARIFELDGKSLAPSILGNFLCKNRPELLLSVNFRGLDGEGRLFYLLRALDIPVAIWLVDNPWHLLSGQRLPWWQDAQIFVSDPAFIAGLRTQGARHVYFLPLAVAPQMWRPLPEPDIFVARCQKPPLFVGRAVFPGHERYFSGCHLPEGFCAQAEALLEQIVASGKQSEHPQSPDYLWWLAKLCPNGPGPELWPGNLGRVAGFGAELMGRKLRQAWLNAALQCGLELRGDQSWTQILPGTRILTQVDYYDALPELYAKASAVLSIPNLLLPSGLNQRHFDVWAAGGVLFSSYSRGMRLFPPYLRVPVSLDRPEDFPHRLAALRADPGFFWDLAKDWRAYLAKEHSYARRLARIFASLGLHWS